MIEPSEQNIVQSISHYLSLMHIPYAHIRNSGNIIHRDGKVIFGRTQFSQPGISDFIACVESIGLAIEVKSRKGKVRPEQERWLKNWEEKGKGQSLVARSLEDVISKVESIKKASRDKTIQNP